MRQCQWFTPRTSCSIQTWPRIETLIRYKTQVGMLHLFRATKSQMRCLKIGAKFLAYSITAGRKSLMIWKRDSWQILNCKSWKKPDSLFPNKSLHLMQTSRYPTNTCLSTNAQSEMARRVSMRDWEETRLKLRRSGAKVRKKKVQMWCTSLTAMPLQWL